MTVPGAVRTRRSLVPRGVAERLTNWLAWYRPDVKVDIPLQMDSAQAVCLRHDRSITLLLSPEQLDALPFICRKLRGARPAASCIWKGFDVSRSLDD